MSSSEEREALWEHHFAQVGGGKGRVLRLSASEFQRVYAGEMLAHFPDEAFFSVDRLVEPALRGRREQTAEKIKDSLPRFHAALEIDGATAAIFSGGAFSARVWGMWVSAVAPSFRRRGIYSRILAAQLGYARELGFETVKSEHRPGNNPVIIAKLRAGFKITALELNAGIGPTLVLSYFL